MHPYIGAAGVIEAIGVLKELASQVLMVGGIALGSSCHPAWVVVSLIGFIWFRRVRKRLPVTTLYT